MADLFSVHRAEIRNGMGYSALLNDHRPLACALAHALIKLVHDDADQRGALEMTGAGGMLELHTPAQWDGLSELIDRILIHFPISLYLGLDRPNPNDYLARGKGPAVSTELASALSDRGDSLVLAVPIRYDFFTTLNEICAGDPLGFGHDGLALGKYYQAHIVDNSIVTDKAGNVLQKFTFYPWHAEKQNPVC